MNGRSNNEGVALLWANGRAFGPLLFVRFAVEQRNPHFFRGGGQAGSVFTVPEWFLGGLARLAGCARRGVRASDRSRMRNRRERREQRVDFLGLLWESGRVSRSTPGPHCKILRNR
jgi:hypothetical protein